VGSLKTFFSPALVKRLAADVRAVHPRFDERAFVADATRGLAKLELLDRAALIARALAAHLPGGYPEAIDVLVRSLGPEHETDELLGVGMAPFFYMPHVIFVAEHGLDHFEVSMRAQYELTKRFSAESSIRAFIDRDPERTFAVLRRWARDPNAHVRRLVSEGTRLRLPWARRVAWLDEHPERVLEVLELLKGDPTTLVRRSVANSLNDLGKVHPELLVRTAKVWLDESPTPERRAMVEHALRSAVKRGEKRALALLGYGGEASVRLEKVSFEPRRVRIGGRVVATFVLRSRSPRAQSLLVDLAVHFVKARGTGAKVFKLGRVELPARGTASFRAAISLAIHTTRKPRPGRHAVDVLVNGKALRAGAFVVIGGDHAA
jgi:3-methyladenine DNA glycosylase AlkC